MIARPCAGRVDGDQGDVRLGLHDDVGEELVTRAFGLEPDHVDPQQHLLEGGPGGVVGIDDRKTANGFSSD